MDFILVFIIKYIYKRKKCNRTWLFTFLVLSLYLYDSVNNVVNIFLINIISNMVTQWEVIGFLRSVVCKGGLVPIKRKISM